eukprot:CAMPEP_0119541490 /NCGR_PEP_ID=MMETSP1344-20130328/52983_1 /TAXON_ID=236787 /ORGANISM="Florenciella parvula, Strain CCMP2471" /LENGTH=200 /DNA_ID=CAMNT_0007585475 /DNA_START=94 /DNA_END=697 /DNA_ORIENTATION=+
MFVRIATIIVGLAATGADAFTPMTQRWTGQGRMAVRSEFKVTLKGPNGDLTEIECPPDKFILDAAEEQGVALPFDCRLGSCVACAARVGPEDIGNVDNSEQFFLSDELLADGYILSCAAYPTADITVETFSSDEVNAAFESQHLHWDLAWRPVSCLLSPPTGRESDSGSLPPSSTAPQEPQLQQGGESRGTNPSLPTRPL